MFTVQWVRCSCSFPDSQDVKALQSVCTKDKFAVGSSLSPSSQEVKNKFYELFMNLCLQTQFSQVYTSLNMSVPTFARKEKNQRS